jgi:hypothetical protein
MDILHINKQKDKFHYIQTYYKNEKKTKIKQIINLRQNKLLNKKRKRKEKEKQ